jgi:large subunit ribosomal protein L17
MSMGNSKLHRNTSSRLALLRDLTTQLILHGRIETTATKAHELKREADKLVTMAKQGDLAAIRHAGETVRPLSIDNQTALQKLFKEIGPRYAARNGGYTRVYKIGYRKGDGCPMAIIEFV